MRANGLGIVSVSTTMANRIRCPVRGLLSLAPGWGRSWMSPPCVFAFGRGLLEGLRDLGEDILRDLQAEGLRSPQVQRQAEARRLFDRQFGWRGAVEDLGDVDGSAAAHAVVVGL